MRLVLERLDLVEHQLVELVGAHVAADHQAQVVGEEIHDHRIVEQLRVLGEHRAFGRIVDVPLDGQHAVAARFGQQLVLQGQHLHVHRLVVLEAALEGGGSLEGALDRLTVVGGQECAQCRTADDQHLGRLVQRTETATGQHVAAEHGDEDHGESDHDQHDNTSLAQIRR
ncbi:hypothetical protein D9M71_598140 [compost metagenome]